MPVPNEQYFVEKPAYCNFSVETGPCPDSIPRYYYNSRKGSCEQFIYGGCEGNPNNFEELQECKSKCH